MVMRRQCIAKTANGEPCRAAPLRDSQYCLMHSPEHAKEVQEGRRLGGLRRKREVTVLAAYDIERLDTLEGIIRLIQIVAADTISMENSIARSRTLLYLAQVALKALEVGNLEQRIFILEQSVRPSNLTHAKITFDVEPGLLETGEEEKS